MTAPFPSELPAQWLLRNLRSLPIHVSSASKVHEIEPRSRLAQRPGLHYIFRTEDPPGAEEAIRRAWDASLRTFHFAPSGFKRGLLRLPHPPGETEWTSQELDLLHEQGYNPVVWKERYGGYVIMSSRFFDEHGRLVSTECPGADFWILQPSLLRLAGSLVDVRT